MTRFTIEVLVGEENRIVQVASPRGDDYLEVISRLQGGEIIGLQDYKCLIDYCTDLSDGDVQQMGPRAMTKTLHACSFVLQDKTPNSETELIPNEFGDWTGDLV